MKEYFKLLTGIGLFSNIKPDELEDLLVCLRAKKKEFLKDEEIFTMGMPVSGLGIVLRGKAQVLREDPWGKRTILTELGVGDVFGETFVLAGVEISPVTVLSMSFSEVLFLKYGKIPFLCGNQCSGHQQLIENLLNLLATKNILLNQKNEILSQRSIREKVMTFLGLKSSGKERVNISFTREQLADFLCVDRSALSRELSKMKEDGLIDYQGSKFKILKKGLLENGF